MEYFNEKYRAGLIDHKNYEKMLEITAHLEENEYRLIGNIGVGSYGSVFKVKHLKSGEEFATKVVEKKYASEGETDTWKNLKHKNILELTDTQFVHYADSYLFFTPVYPMTLEQKVLEPSFMQSKNAFKKAKMWLKEILEAAAYLHNNHLSHNDIKGNNVFISGTDTAVLADFGFLTSTKDLIDKYGAPFIYRCPEGRPNETGFAALDGQKLDVWSIGMLAFEMFTKISLLAEFSKCNDNLNCWYTDIYPVLQNSLQQTSFTKLMKEAFPKSKISNEIVDNVTSFITSCLNIIPDKRPCVSQLQKHKLFGGSWENVENINEVNIWKNRMNVTGIVNILKQNNLEIPKNLIEESHCSEHNVNGILASSEKLPHDDINYITSQQYLSEEKVPNSQAEQCSINKSDEKKLPDFASKFDESVSLVASKKSLIDIIPPTVEKNQSLSTQQSLIDPQRVLNSEYDFAFSLSETSQDTVSHSSCIVSPESSNRKTVNTKNISCGRIFRIWWKRQKRAVTRLFRISLPCVKKNDRSEE